MNPYPCLAYRVKNFGGTLAQCQGTMRLTASFVAGRFYRCDLCGRIAT